ncbi:MAG: NAD(P)H-dependent oxidoreductase [Gammaproteobacteria bacterium]|nr:NAD(P)H-dependent oxidoreductase [Gammaproteobacteria bacterium]
MNVLAVFAHPKRESFTGALLDHFVQGCSDAGHNVIIADLYREGFDAIFKTEDFSQFVSGGTMPTDVRREQARVDAADVLAFVFPVWWWSFPAILKGWIDRVWSEGWAYTFTPEKSMGLLKDRPIFLLGSAGSTERTYRKYRYDEAMNIELDIGVMNYCGLFSVTTKIFYDVNDNPDTLKAHLAAARSLGRAIT